MSAPSAPSRPRLPTVVSEVTSFPEELRKALFRSPVQTSEDETTSGSPDAAEGLMKRLQIEYDIEASLRLMNKELQEQRLKQLKDLQKDIVETDWRYTPIEKLIGLH